MRRQTALPRISREGWVPAAPEKRVNKRAMLIPKTGKPSDHLPTLMDFSEVICPPERRALREIVETAEVVREGDHLYLLARVSAATLDSLATFETAREDLEEDDEPSIGAGSGGVRSTRSLTIATTSRSPTRAPTRQGFDGGSSRSGTSRHASLGTSIKTVASVAPSSHRATTPPRTRRRCGRSSGS